MPHLNQKAERTPPPLHSPAPTHSHKHRHTHSQSRTCGHAVRVSLPSGSVGPTMRPIKYGQLI